MQSAYRKKHITPKIRGFRKTKKFLQRPWFWVLVSALSIFIGVSSFLLLSPRFQISEVAISGNAKIHNLELEYAAFKGITKNLINLGNITITSKNFFLFDSKKLSANIVKDFLHVKEATVAKKLPRQVSIFIKEREALAVFCESESRCFLIDEAGIIFEETSQAKGLMTMSKEPNKGVILGKNAVSAGIMEAILRIKNELENNFQIGVSEVIVNDLLIFKTSERFKLYVDPAGDMNAQVTKLNIVLRDEIPAPSRKDIQYIYLQYKDKAYYQ